MTGSPAKTISEQVLDLITTTLDQEKAEDIVQISLRGRSEMADHMVIASGRSTRQVVAVSEKLSEKLKAELGILCKVEGTDTGDWV